MDQINERVWQAAEQLSRSRLRLACMESGLTNTPSTLVENERRLCMERQETLKRVIREEGWTFDVRALDEAILKLPNTIPTRDEGIRAMSISFIREALLTPRDDED